MCAVMSRACVILFGDGRSVPRETYDLLLAALADEANRHMRKAGRSAWSRADYDAGIAEFTRLADALAMVEP